MSGPIKLDQEASVPEDDVLERILVVAIAEGALGVESVGAFAKALRERARVVLAERVRPVEERAAAIEKENAWRAGILKALEAENLWRRESMAGLEKESAWRAAALATLEQENARLGGEAEALRAERERAAAAHDRLLEHHRKVVAEVVEALGRIPGLLPWRFRRVRAEVGELVQVLGKELG